MDKLEKIRLSFSRYANLDVASLNAKENLKPILLFPFINIIFNLNCSSSLFQHDMSNAFR